MRVRVAATSWRSPASPPKALQPHDLLERRRTCETRCDRRARSGSRAPTLLPGAVSDRCAGSAVQEASPKRRCRFAATNSASRPLGEPPLPDGPVILASGPEGAQRSRAGSPSVLGRVCTCSETTRLGDGAWTITGRRSSRNSRRGHLDAPNGALAQEGRLHPDRTASQSSQTSRIAAPSRDPTSQSARSLAAAKNAAEARRQPIVGAADAIDLSLARYSLSATRARPSPARRPADRSACSRRAARKTRGCSRLTRIALHFATPAVRPG